MGCYEGRGECVFTDGVPDSFGMQLFPDDLDKLFPYLEKAIERVPILETAGIKSVVNGPQPYTPDDLPIAGPAFGLKNFWLGEGNPNGVTLSGGIGWQLAEWIVEGAPSIDMAACDPQRFGDFATRPYSMRKTEEAYERTYQIPLPGEELTACRPLKTTPLHDILASRRAVFGSIYGWERPNWFAPDGVSPSEAYSFRTPSFTGHVRAECRAARSDMVLADISHGTKFRIHGTGLAAWLESRLTGYIPEPGRFGAAFLLTPAGTFRAALRLFREHPSSILVEGPPQAERAYLDALLRELDGVGSLRLDNITGREGCLLLSGPASGDLLARLSRADITDKAATDFGDAAFPAGTGRPVTVGYAPVLAMRSDRFGFPGWELHCAAEYVRHVFLRLTEADADIRLIGARSLDALRLADAEPGWGTELSMGWTLAESGLGDGHASRRLVLLAMRDPSSPAPFGEEPVYGPDGSMVGHTTSGGIDYTGDGYLAFAYVDALLSKPGMQFGILLLGKTYSAAVRERVGDPRNSTDRFTEE